MSELLEEVEECLLVTWRFADTADWLKRLVGEKVARDGLPLKLEGRACPVVAVEIGVRPRRELWRLLLLLHADGGPLVLRGPEDEVVGFAVGKEESFAEEGGGWLIDTTRTFGW